MVDWNRGGNDFRRFLLIPLFLPFLQHHLHDYCHVLSAGVRSRVNTAGTCNLDLCVSQLDTCICELEVLVVFKLKNSFILHFWTILFKHKLVNNLSLWNRQKWRCFGWSWRVGPFLPVWASDLLQRQLPQRALDPGCEEAGLEPDCCSPHQAWNPGGCYPDRRKTKLVQTRPFHPLGQWLSNGADTDPLRGCLETGGSTSGVS